MLKIKQFEFSLFGVNTYLVIDEDTKQAAVIDPAMEKSDEQKRFDKYVEDNGITITQIINTHLHVDHCFGYEYVKDKYGVPEKAHIDDAPFGEAIDTQLQMFGRKPKGTQVVIDVPLKDGDTIQIGDSKLQVIHVPGHTPGGIALYYPEGNVVFSGDSLFKGSIGRTDIGGNYDQLISSIKNKLFTLPEGTLVLSGHGPSTTIGQEKATNPFFK